MDYECILVEKENRVTTITLNRPEKLNALTMTMRWEILRATQEAAKDPDTNVLVFTGAGKGFCSGGDVEDMAAKKFDSPLADPALKVKSPQDLGNLIVILIRQMSKPVIASVNGVAAGGGCNLALACDIRIGSEKARFGQVFVRRGLHPDWGGTFFLPHLVGTAKACELIFTGDVIDAVESEKIGLLNKLVPQEKLAETTREFALKLAKGASIPMGLAKRAIYKAMQTDLSSILEYELYAQRMCTESEDYHEGLKSFLEKREPNFKGK
ncbi:MAG: enoyl-CoA hydratase [Candidatus Tectomicrobia bacterium]|uniref:Enoyl-CoA hydratase n=1 Tax=Tectimicrobiota bacterium TaxID=2528274 RepID=A0A933GP21_UNCTE|nr:enoyl-CoA hydratase [Candidatus Tectomicrobia bacterium]